MLIREMACTCHEKGLDPSEIYQIISHDGKVMAWGRKTCPEHCIFTEVEPAPPEPPPDPFPTAPENRNV